MLLVASPTAQVAQLVRPSWIVLPQPRHRLSRRGALIDDGKGGAPFTSRLTRCVSRVAGADSRASLAELDQSARVTHSAKGATARPHIGIVSDSRATKGAIRRQFPSLCSKSHSRLSGSFIIQSSRNASTCGRMGSIRSHARLSRALVSTWSTPRPGSSPRATAAKRDSDSSRP